jgi:hypothetical protein
MIALLCLLPVAKIPQVNLIRPYGDTDLGQLSFRGGGGIRVHGDTAKVGWSEISGVGGT